MTTLINYISNLGQKRVLLGAAAMAVLIASALIWIH